MAFQIERLTQSGRIDSGIALDARRRPYQLVAMSNDAMPTVQMLLLQRIDGSKNMSRYYVLEIAPTMFGDTALVREWGRIGSSVRRCIDLHADAARAGEALSERLNRKTKRGYVIAHRA